MHERRFLVTCVVLMTLIWSAVVVEATVKTVTLRVRGMTCGGCATTVEKALKSTDGVEEVMVSFERGRAVIKYDDQKVTVAKLRLVIQSTGFFCDLDSAGKKSSGD